ncbi:MAG: caspase family protein, partial [Spirochaetales bacterium]|nr:caspase family protein [Spirochaetales bacterium]
MISDRLPFVSGSLVVLVLLLASCSMHPAPSAAPDFAGLQMHAIVVGINDYIDNRNLGDLRGPVPDADSMANLLEQSGWILHRLIAREAEETRRAATKEAIRQALFNVPPEADLV